MVEKDQQNQLYLLEKYSTRLGKRVCLLPQYEEFRCPKCGKFDQISALRTGISPTVKVKARTDVVCTAEDWTVVSARFRNIVEKHKIQGVEFVPIPSSPEFFVYIPTILVPIDEKRCKARGMEFEKKCKQCGRFLTTTGWPDRKSMQVPEGELVMFTPNGACECPGGQVCMIYTTETVQKIFESNGITGVDSYMSLEDDDSSQPPPTAVSPARTKKVFPIKQVKEEQLVSEGLLPVAAEGLIAFLKGNRRKLPREGEKGTLTSWMLLCKMGLASGQLWAGDPMLPNDSDGCVADLPVGHYLVEARCMVYGTSKFVSQLRIRREDADKCETSCEIGTVGTDSAQIAVCDVALLRDKRYDESLENLDDKADGLCGVLRIGEYLIPYVASGFGDGTGPVFELLQKKKPVGIMLDFFPEEEDSEE
ncbi:MAG: hypothetical protein EHM48_03975 [Planctomycetaceae bacterium]|nr:MAG: hypothetical protein EHM48_03975 [Planctomycetaceae bacterium]